VTELLTDEELQSLHEHGNTSWLPFVKLLAAYEVLAAERERTPPLLKAAIMVGYWWHAQDGIGKAELDALADAVAVYSGEAKPEEPAP
jgi:hypothetical protein